MSTSFHESKNLPIDPIPEQVEFVAKKVLDFAFKDIWH